mgnify:FL=1
MVNQKMRRFNYIIGEIDNLYHEASVKLGLSDATMTILYVLSQNDDSCVQRDIYQLTGMTRQTVNSAVRKLVKEGIVATTAGEGRTVVVTLTPEGRKLAERTVHRILTMEDEIFGTWTDEEIDFYLELTERYRDQIREKISKEL